MLQVCMPVLQFKLKWGLGDFKRSVLDSIVRFIFLYFYMPLPITLGPLVNMFNTTAVWIQQE